MEDKKTFRPHFNIFDVVIILLAVAVVGAAMLLRNRSTGGETTARATVPIRYTVELSRAPKDMVNQIRVGDDIYRSTDSAYMGKIVDVRHTAHQENEYAISASGFVRYEVPESDDIYITVEGQGYWTGKDLIVEGVSPKVCGEMYVKGKGFARLGFVVSIDTMGAQIEPGKSVGSGNLEMTYVICLSDMREVLLDGVHVGDQLYEKVTGALLGTVEDVWAEPYGETRVGADGKAVYAEKEGVYYQYARVKGRAVEKADGYYLDGGTELKIGAAVIATSRYVERTGAFYALEKIEKVS